MRIIDVRARTVTVPLEAPLRHSNGAHWGRFVRTVVEVETDNGLIGLGEMGGGGQGASDAIKALKPYLSGHDPAHLEALRWMLANPTASLYNDRTQLLAAIEFACLDLVGKNAGLSATDLLGGSVRDEVEFASYLFFRFPAPDGSGEVRTPDQLVSEARRLRDLHGFRVHKLKGGVFPPEYELACYRALAEEFPEDFFRYDPNGVLSVKDALMFAEGIKDLRNDYLEDPVYSLPGMQAVRERTLIPLATNTVVTNFEQLAQNVLNRAVDVILLDTTFWGGIRQCIRAGGVCETFSLGVAVHSSGELGIQLASMLHLGAVLPNLSFAADAHYHHLQHDIVAGGLSPYVDGKIAVPTSPGLGVELDQEAMALGEDRFRRWQGYTYDRDPSRPNWYPVLPNSTFADPAIGGIPQALEIEYAKWR